MTAFGAERKLLCVLGGVRYCPEAAVPQLVIKGQPSGKGDTYELVAPGTLARNPMVYTRVQPIRS